MLCCIILVDSTVHREVEICVWTVPKMSSHGFAGYNIPNHHKMLITQIVQSCVWKCTLFAEYIGRKKQLNCLIINNAQFDLCSFVLSNFKSNVKSIKNYVFLMNCLCMLVKREREREMNFVKFCLMLHHCTL